MTAPDPFDLDYLENVSRSRSPSLERSPGDSNNVNNQQTTETISKVQASLRLSKISENGLHDETSLTNLVKSRHSFVPICFGDPNMGLIGTTESELKIKNASGSGFFGLPVAMQPKPMSYHFVPPSHISAIQHTVTSTASSPQSKTHSIVYIASQPFSRQGPTTGYLPPHIPFQTYVDEFLPNFVMLWPVEENSASYLAINPEKVVDVAPTSRSSCIISVEELMPCGLGQQPPHQANHMVRPTVQRSWKIGMGLMEVLARLDSNSFERMWSLKYMHVYDPTKLGSGDATVVNNAVAPVDFGYGIRFPPQAQDEDAKTLRRYEKIRVPGPRQSFSDE